MAKSILIKDTTVAERAQIVLYTYPKANTSGCTAEARTICIS